MKIETRRLHLMGTVITLQVEASQPMFLLDNAEVRLRDYQQRFSANDATSDLMNINHQSG